MRRQDWAFQKKIPAPWNLGRNNQLHDSPLRVTGLALIGAGWVEPTYDAAGNMISGPKPGAETTTELNFVYDAWNRLVKFTDGDENTIAEYRYDGLGRRIAKIVPNGDDWDRTDYLYDEAWQVLEERTDTFEDLEGEGGARETPAETPAVQWLWDVRYVDAPVLRWRDADLDSETGYLGLEETLYACNDANMNLTALVSASGTVAERYVYDAYGKATVYDDDWSTTVTWASSKKNEILFGGYLFDPESGLYYVRRRYYHTTLARFLVRDKAGYIDGLNLYEYVMSAAPHYVDPYGGAASPTATPPQASTPSNPNLVPYRALEWKDFTGPVPGDAQQAASTFSGLVRKDFEVVPLEKDQWCVEEPDRSKCQKDPVGNRYPDRQVIGQDGKTQTIKGRPYDPRRFFATCWKCAAQVNPNARIESFFDPQKSWVRGGKGTASVLRHEQGHFRIAEAVARKYSAEIKQINPRTITVYDCDYDRGFSRVYDPLYQKLEDIWMRAKTEIRQVMADYDKTTDHGTNPAEQGKWDSLLNDAKFPVRPPAP